jgi:hypothetical protein
MKLLLANPVVQRTHNGVEPMKKEIGSDLTQNVARNLYFYLRKCANFWLLPVNRDDYEDECGQVEDEYPSKDDQSASDVVCTPGHRGRPG